MNPETEKIEKTKGTLIEGNINSETYEIIMEVLKVSEM